MKKLSCALVGFGGIGHHHASRYAHCKNVRLVAICDIDPARLEEAQSATNLGAGKIAADTQYYRDRAGLGNANPSGLAMDITAGVAGGLLPGVAELGKLL